MIEKVKRLSFNTILHNGNYNYIVISYRIIKISLVKKKKKKKNSSECRVYESVDDESQS